MCGRYPHSIGCTYLSSPNYSPGNFTLLTLVTDMAISEKHYKLPPPNMTIVHLRIGDVLNPQFVDPVTDDCFGNSCVFSPNRRQYAYPKPYYERLIDTGQILPPNETRITVVAFSFHTNNGRHGYKASLVASNNYIGNLTSFFQSRGYSVKNRGDRVPDRDFAFLTHARIFVPGGGNYAKLVEEVVRFRGGTSLRGEIDRE